MIAPPRPASLVFAVLLAPLALAALAPVGCGPDKPEAKVAPKPSSSTTVTFTVSDAGPGGPTDGAPAGDAWTAGAADAIDMSTGDAPAANANADGAAGPCWKGFNPTGAAVPDLDELARRCCAGMSPLVGPVKQVFKQGEAKTIPVPFVPGCYRIIAVGGNGLKDVDLELKDPGGKLVAADNTPNDVFPMIHPNKEFCVDALQLLNLSIVVKKGGGEVAGGVWKR